MGSTVGRDRGRRDEEAFLSVEVVQLMAMTPQAWLAVLEIQLMERQAHLELMNSYYIGDHPLPWVNKAHAEKIRNEFRQLLDDNRSNFMELVVDSMAERLSVEGFRLSAADDQAADRASWDIWQANEMDSESQVAFVEALVKGRSYVSVWEPDGSRFAQMAVEDPLQTIVGYEPGSGMRKRAAALKVFKDSDGQDRANVYMPNGIYKFEAAGAEIGGATMSAKGATFEEERSPVRSAGAGTSASRWKLLDTGSFVRNRLGDVVPIVPLRNRPRLLVEGRSELASVFRIQNQANGFLFLLALAGFFGAHRQRWVSGVALYDEENKPIDMFAAVDRVWADENPEAKFGDFEQTSLDGYIKAIEQKVAHIAITTRTPKHYLLPEGQEPSGDAIKSAEAGLVKKVGSRQRTFGEGLEEAIRLARRFQGEADAPVDSEIVWADPQIRTEAEITDATIKKYQARLITWEQACSDMGYSPQTVSRMLEAFGGTAPTPNDVTPNDAVPADPAAA
jgi:hypothetical protein